jgi:DNA repair protein RadC
MKTSDASLLSAVLGVDESASIAQRLEELGGLAGVWKSGGSSMDGVIAQPLCDRLGAVCELAERLLESPKLASEIDGARAVADYFHPRLALHSVESFWVLLLDARSRPLGSICVAQGTLTACLVHPREVFAPAIRMRAASIIAVHNHPSGDPTPSEEDETLTARLARAGELLGIPLIDHVIVARGGYRSLGPSEPTRTALTPARARGTRR